MAKLTITIEDTPDGGVFIAGDPSLEELCARAATPDKQSSAEGYAMVAWVALRGAAEQAAKDSGGKWAAWDDGRTVN